MGFSLLFVRMNGDQQIDADRVGLARFLQQRGLHVSADAYGGSLCDQDDASLKFDGNWSDLYLAPLDQEGMLEGGIFHATLSPDECEFIYDLCVAAGWLIVNPQGDPMCLIPGRNHNSEDLVHFDEIAWIQSGVELEQALTGSFAEFSEFRTKALGMRQE